MVQSVVKIIHRLTDFFCLFFFNYSKRTVEVFQPCAYICLFFPFCPPGFCFMYSEALLLGAWMFRIVALLAELHDGPLC